MRTDILIIYEWNIHGTDKTTLVVDAAAAPDLFA